MVAELKCTFFFFLLPLFRAISKQTYFTDTQVLVFLDLGHSLGLTIPLLLK